ncbi:MAG: PPC domain-containing protein, partial [Actinobacteria bacterium]|nr:PPC domain-containing protein [Actinomycetota bacterium]
MTVARADGPSDVGPQRIGVDSPVEGSLVEGDRTLPDGRPVDTYLLPGGAQGLVDVRVEAQGHRPEIVVLFPSREAIMARADGNGRASVTTGLAEEGAYHVQVIAGERGSGGPYRLSVHASGATAASASTRTHHRETVAPGPGAEAASTTVAHGSVTRGDLRANDPRLHSGEFYDRFDLQGTAGQRVVLNLDSTAFDPYLLVVAPDGRRFENDDANGGRGSEISETLPVAGTYRILATSYRSGETGAYELKVRSGAEAQGIVLDPVEIGGGGQAPGTTTRQGELREGDGRLPSGEFVDTHTFRWERGLSVRVELSSTALDPYVIVRMPDGRQLDNDDAQPGNLNAALDVTPSATGTYTVLTTTYEPGMTGAYELRVTTRGGAATPTEGGGGQTPQTPTTPPVEPGRVTDGTLAAGDRRITSGEFMDEHTVEARAGSSLQITLESSEFDTYLIVRPPSGRQIDNDDVAQGNTNSRVEIASADAGTYRIQVTSYQPGETGRYRLTVSTRAAGATGGGGGE